MFKSSKCGVVKTSLQSLVVKFHFCLSISYGCQSELAECWDPLILCSSKKVCMCICMCVCVVHVRCVCIRVCICTCEYTHTLRFLLFFYSSFTGFSVYSSSFPTLDSLGLGLFLCLTIGLSLAYNQARRVSGRRATSI